MKWQKLLAKLLNLTSYTLLEICQRLDQEKIMRRILRKIANNDTENLGDVTTLADPKIVEELMENKV